MIFLEIYDNSPSCLSTPIVLWSKYLQIDDTFIDLTNVHVVPSFQLCLQKKCGRHAEYSKQIWLPWRKCWKHLLLHLLLILLIMKNF